MEREGGIERPYGKRQIGDNFSTNAVAEILADPLGIHVERAAVVDSGD